MAKMNYFGHTHSEMREKEHRVIQTSKKKKKTQTKGPLCCSCIPTQKHDLWMTKICILDQICYSFTFYLSASKDTH